MTASALCPARRRPRAPIHPARLRLVQRYLGGGYGVDFRNSGRVSLSRLNKGCAVSRGHAALMCARVQPQTVNAGFFRPIGAAVP